jgi:muconate cycloisomerase
MKINAINIYKVSLPFKLPFSHSRKKVISADNVVVEIVTDEPDLRGYGEGGPRLYVTGETQDSAIHVVGLLCLNPHFPWSIDNVGQVWNFANLVTAEKGHNSALCAVEMALLDLLGKKDDRNILHYLPKRYYTDQFLYGGTVPIANRQTVLKVCALLKEYDIKEIRMKMGRDLNQNRQAIEAVCQFENWKGGLRVDVNGAWDIGIAKMHLPLLVSHGVNVLEQPLMPEDPNWKELASMLRAEGIKLMADESVCSMEELDEAAKSRHFDMIHIRLSKCGGVLSSLKMIDRIRTEGLDYQVGCQLGESGILSAAGRALCAVCSDALYYDGCYDEFLLRENLTTEHVTFNHGGKATPLKGMGLGVSVDEANLNQFGDCVSTIHRP